MTGKKFNSPKKFGEKIFRGSKIFFWEEGGMDKGISLGVKFKTSRI